MPETRVLSFTLSDSAVNKGFKQRFFVILIKNVKIVMTKIDPLRFRGV